MIIALHHQQRIVIFPRQGSRFLGQFQRTQFSAQLRALQAGGEVDDLDGCEVPL